jgi:hypothetical protein
MSVLRAPFENPPQPLGMPCWEGMATSDVSPRIAWNRSDIDYTDPDLVSRVVNGISEIWTGELRYEDERVLLENVDLVIDRTAVSPLAVLEVQDFRAGTDELIFTAYAYEGGEVMGVNLSTGLVTNRSQSPVYEEAEGAHSCVDGGGRFGMLGGRESVRRRCVASRRGSTDLALAASDGLHFLDTYRTLCAEIGRQAFHAPLRCGLVSASCDVGWFSS